VSAPAQHLAWPLLAAVNSGGKDSLDGDFGMIDDSIRAACFIGGDASLGDDTESKALFGAIEGFFIRGAFFFVADLSLDGAIE
jgi:hypothetical protein